MDAATLSDVALARERFPLARSYIDFHDMFEDHGKLVSGKPFEIDVLRYAVIERENRLAFFAARRRGRAVGYSCHFWYMSLHWHERVGHDDMWYVRPECRGLGIGTALRNLGHEWLRKCGCEAVEDILRLQFSADHPQYLAAQGYVPTHTRWLKKL